MKPANTSYNLNPSLSEVVKDLKKPLLVVGAVLVFLYALPYKESQQQQQTTHQTQVNFLNNCVTAFDASDWSYTSAQKCVDTFGVDGLSRASDSKEGADLSWYFVNRKNYKVDHLLNK
jgi:hypothetical protein